jgi:hypothetical protein
MIRDSGKSGNNKHCVRKAKDPIFIYSVVCVSSCVSAVSVGQRRAASSRSLTFFSLFSLKFSGNISLHVAKSRKGGESSKPWLALEKGKAAG